MGRSVGCIPAIHLASQRNVAFLSLVSPFMSVKVTQSHIQQIMKDHYGFMGSIGSLLVKKGYSIKDKLSLIKCPTLLLHGKKDTLISWQQSANIYDALETKAELIMHDEMTHNDIDTLRHIVLPIMAFIEKAEIRADNDTMELSVPLKFFDFDSAS